MSGGRSHRVGKQENGGLLNERDPYLHTLLQFWDSFDTEQHSTGHQLVSPCFRDSGSGTLHFINITIVSEDFRSDEIFRRDIKINSSQGLEKDKRVTLRKLRVCKVLNIYEFDCGEI